MSYKLLASFDATTYIKASPMDKMSYIGELNNYITSDLISVMEEQQMSISSIHHDYTNIMAGAKESQGALCSVLQLALIKRSQLGIAGVFESYLRVLDFLNQYVAILFAENIQDIVTPEVNITSTLRKAILAEFDSRICQTLTGMHANGLFKAEKPQSEKPVQTAEDLFKQFRQDFGSKPSDIST